jgi:hypothetical protein
MIFAATTWNLVSTINRRYSMHTRTHDIDAAVLHDYPPLDKPDRLPLRQRWKTTGGEQATVPRTGDCTDPARQPRFRIIADGAFGGEVRALNELALGQARAAVRDAHLQQVVFEDPTVHTYVDANLQLAMEPLMFVRLNAPRSRCEAIVEELRRRRARLHDVELHNAVAVVRAEAPLERLLGFEPAIAEPAQPAVQVAIWPLRYEPVGGWNAVAAHRFTGADRGGGAR